MREIENSIIPFVATQFPAFYREEGDKFIAFVKAYYEWMEQQGQPLYFSRRLYDYVDIDKTVDGFLTNFKEKYASGFPINVTGNTETRFATANVTNVSLEQTANNASQREFIKKTMDLYKAKGNESALNLLFRTLFQEPVQTFLPSTDILKPCDGKWFIAKYLEISITEKNKDFVGKIITGLASGATATVEKLSRRTLSGNLIDVLYLTNINGSFQYGEIVTYDGLAEGSPRVIGSLREVVVTAGGSGYEVGQTVDLVSSLTGRGAKGRVAEIGTATGKIIYELERTEPSYGGYGYTANASVYISSKVLFTDARVVGNDKHTNYIQFESVRQPLANVPFTAAQGTFANGQLIFGIDASTTPNTVIVGGIVLIANQTPTNNGWLLLSPRKIANVTINNISSPNTTGSFVVGETVYQSNNETGRPHNAGYVLKANTTTVLIDVAKGTFYTDQFVVGTQSNCTANALISRVYLGEFTDNIISNLITPDNFITAIRDGNATDRTASGIVVGANSIAVGLMNITSANPFINAVGNYIISNTSQIFAICGSTSAGNPGGFDIGSLTDTETIFLNTDRIGANNVNDVPYLSLSLNASEYGFPKYPLGNVNTVIDVCLTKDSFEIGSIASLKNINLGSNNTAAPFVRIYDEIIAPSIRRNFTLVLSSPSKPFLRGEQILQSFPDGAVTLNVSSVTGTFNTAGRELLRQERGDGTTVYGELVEEEITAGSGTIRVRVANTSNTFDTSNTIVGTNSSATAVITTVTPNNYFSVAKGIVLSSNTISMDIVRRSYSVSFSRGIPITGSVSGANAMVVAVYETPNSPVIGNNAVVTANASVVEGTIRAVEIIDSGHGYYDLEPVLIANTSNPSVAAGYVRMISEGFSQGFYRDTGGSISGDKKIQDSNYYQEFSYEVQSSISLDKYASILKETLQVAGTKLFGKVNKYTTLPLTIDVPDNTRGTILTITSNTSNSFIAGNDLRNNTNTALGRIESYVSTLVIEGSNNEFVVGNEVAYPSFVVNAANATIAGISYNVASNTTTLDLMDVRGAFISSNTIETGVNRKFIEYTMDSGNLINGEIVYQSNGTANVGVGDLVSSTVSRLVIKPLTDIEISNVSGTILSGDDVYQRIQSTSNTAKGTVFTANTTHILIGNTRGEFLPGYTLYASSGGNAMVSSLGGKLDNFTITDDIFVDIQDLTAAEFLDGEQILQISTGASGTLLSGDIRRLHIANVSGTFIVGENITGTTSNTSATVTVVSGPFKIIGVTSGAVANSKTIESPFTNVTIGVISAINTIELSNVSGMFTISTPVADVATGATANVTSVETILF